MDYADVAVVGAGVLGCFAARALTAYDLRIAVFESREDVCTGISRANTGIVYTGCDTKPGTRKAQLCAEANRDFGSLCETLGVRFSRCGSLMTAFGPRGVVRLEKKLSQGRANGVPGLRLLTPAEVYQREPLLARGVTAALYAPGTGTVDPWELGIAAFENARANGAAFHFSEEIQHIERTTGGYRLETSRRTCAVRAVVNCAGLRADAVRELVKVPAIRIFPAAGDYLVLDHDLSDLLRHVIFHEGEAGKGLTLVPTVDGAILAGPTDREPGEDWAVSPEGLEALTALCAQVVPDLPLERVIRSFAALRPSPRHVRRENGVWTVDPRAIHDFTLLEEDGFISLLGIKTPGLTCAHRLGELAAEAAAHFLGNPGKNTGFDPRRSPPPRLHGMPETERALLVQRNPDYGEIVCRCRDVSLGEIKEALRQGASTVDGVKRRTGAGMGRCQGGRCMQRVIETIAAEQDVSPALVCKDAPGSAVLTGDDGKL